MASERFNEDAITDYAWFPFSGQSCFELGARNLKAMKTLTPLLEKISVECTAEFDKSLLVCFGEGAWFYD